MWSNRFDRRFSLHIQPFQRRTAMKAKRRAPRTIDAYIAGFPADVKVILEKIRSTIHQAAPGGDEKISYQIPAFTLHGKPLIYFRGVPKAHRALSCARSSEEFQAELAGYAGGKGTVQFPLDRPIPFGLIRRIVKFRIKENRARAAAKAKKD